VRNFYAKPQTHLKIAWIPINEQDWVSIGYCYPLLEINELRTLAEPGRYSNPVLSPDQSLLLFNCDSESGVLWDSILAFQKDNKTSTLAAILNQEPAPFGAETPRDLEKIIRRCLQKDLIRPFQNMADIKVALQELKEESDLSKLGSTQEASTAPISRDIAHLAGKKPIYIFAGLLVLAVAYLTFNKYYLKRPSVEPQQVTAVSEVDKAQKTIAILPFEDIAPERVRNILWMVYLKNCKIRSLKYLIWALLVGHHLSLSKVQIKQFRKLVAI